MITDKGKSIIGKYLLGQAPAYASYIAIGCGPKPLGNLETPGDYSEKQSLDFEMFRVPISSKGFVEENGVSKIVLTAELPTEERYEISEIGIYSAGSNPSAASVDSRTIFGFSTAEQWRIQNAGLIPQVTTPLTDAGDIITVTDSIFQANADNIAFTSTQRPFERGRFYNNMVLMRGDTSNLYLNSGDLAIATGSTHINLSGIRTDFSKNAPTDELRLVFSVVHKSATAPEPENVRLMIEFGDQTSSSNYARFEVKLTSSDYNFATNRYLLISKQLQDLVYSTNFSWSAVNTAKIYACAMEKQLIASKTISSNVATLTFSSDHGLTTGDVITVVDSSVNFGVMSGVRTVTVTDSTTITFPVTASDQVTAAGGGAYIEVPSENYYIALDAMRLENVSTQNPLYGLTGYAVVKNFDGETVLKSPNTNNYVEFRFVLGVT